MSKKIYNNSENRKSKWPIKYKCHVAAVTNGYKLGGLSQHKFVL